MRSWHTACDALKVRRLQHEPRALQPAEPPRVRLQRIDPVRTNTLSDRRLRAILCRGAGGFPRFYQIGHIPPKLCRSRKRDWARLQSDLAFVDL